MGGTVCSKCGVPRSYYGVEATESCREHRYPSPDPVDDKTRGALDLIHSTPKCLDCCNRGNCRHNFQNKGWF